MVIHYNNNSHDVGANTSFETIEKTSLTKSVLLYQINTISFLNRFKEITLLHIYGNTVQ